MNKPVLLFSGGLDSYILWHKLGRPPCLYILLNHRYQDRELRTLDTLSGLHPDLNIRLVNGPDLSGQEQPDAHIPWRNLLFSIIAAQLGYNRVYLGAVAGETSRDKSAWFLHKTNYLLQWTEHEDVRVEYPLLRTTKTAAVRWFLARASDQQKVGLLMSRSCYNSGDLPCGKCTACLRRWVALTNNGIQTRYEHNPVDYLTAVKPAQALRYLVRSDIYEWPAIIANNLEVLSALRIARKVTPA